MIDHLSHVGMIARDNIQDIYGLSAMQKSMLVAYMKDESTNAYIEQFSFPLYGTVDAVCMEKAMNMLVSHFDVFRTVFSYKANENPYQIVLRNYEIKVNTVDITKAEDPDKEFEYYKDEERKRGFLLAGESLIRGTLYKISENEWRFLITFHHIILDGWSLGTIFATLFSYYKMIYDNKEIKQFHENVPYKNYIKWLEAKGTAQAKEYWKNYLEGYEKETGIMGFGPGGGQERVSYQFSLDLATYDKIKKLSSDLGFTLNIIFEAVWAIILQKYNNTNDVVFGNVVSGRAIDLADVEKMAGLLINTQPLRVKSDDNTDFVEICRQIQTKMVESSPFEFFPLYEIQSNTSLKNHLLDHAIAFENYPLEDYVKEVELEDGKTIRFGNVDVREQATYDLHIIVNPGNEFKVTFTYNSSVYCDWQISDLAECIKQVINEICEDPHVRAKSICICSETQKQKILEFSEGTNIAYDGPMTVADCFREYARKTPDKKAIVFQERSYTYKEVDRWSDNVATLLSEKGVGKNDYVGIFMGRSPESVVAMLAILKVGAAYVPLNVKESEERLHYIIDDAAMKCVCVWEETKGKIPENTSWQIVEEKQIDAGNTFHVVEASEKDAAYLLFTSGTTGRPKGCIVTNRNILRTVKNQNFIPFNDEDMVLQTASIAFDPSVVEIWGALACGGTLVIADEQCILSAKDMKSIISGNKITAMQLTTPLFDRLIEDDPSIFEGVNYLMVGGDVLKKKNVQKVYEVNPSIHVINGYGPTENTVVSTTCQVDRNNMDREKTSIGKPLNNSFAYIMDEAHNLLPIGAFGELCVGGWGLSEGYLNQKELTESKFISHPFKDGERMFLTGDIALMLPDGNIEFYGRRDSQVKVNGYRIEIGEIEQWINKIKSIKECVVKVETFNDVKYICAFYVSDEELSVADIKSELQANLPSYMIPTYYKRVDRFEMTPNGKIDRKNLYIDIQNNCAPEKLVFASEIEKQIVQIILETTGIGVVQTDENLFDMGITSLNLMSIRNRLNKDYGYDIALSVLFEKSTVSKLAKHIEDMNQSDDRSNSGDDSEVKDEIKVMRNGIKKIDQSVEEEW